MNPATGFARYAGFAAVLSAAGLPIYIHAPKFYVDSYGVTLAQLSVALFLLRLLDVVQDPLLGRLSERTRTIRAPMVAGAAVLMALAMVGLFAVPPLLPPVWWFALTLAVLFSSFSFLTITFYAQGVGKAAALGDGHVRLAAWRETGALLGVCIAAVLPTALAATDAPFAIYAAAFAVGTALAVWAMSPEWRATGTASATGLRAVVRDPTARRLLLIALANATPVAVSSTLFLFFVEDRLGNADAAGPLLLLFFLSAALAAPIWGKLAQKVGTKRALLGAMVLAITSFGWALTLGTGDILPFAFICAASGAAVGADLTLLPAMFARRMEVIAPTAADGFGLWSFVNKITLAFAAIALFPLLDRVGFQSGELNGEQALTWLSWLYAGLPLGLKLVAITLLARSGPDINS